jgi:hypothetical protein
VERVNACGVWENVNVGKSKEGLMKSCGGPLCAHICNRLDIIEPEVLFKRLGSGTPAKVATVVKPVPKEKLDTFKSKVDSDIVAKNNPRSAAPPTEPATKRQKTGYVYDWFQEWSKHAKNGNIGLVPAFARSQTLTWEKFVATPEYEVVEHFENYMNELFE